MIQEEKFNRWFSLFILVGMTVVTCVVTAFKLQASPDGHFWLLMAAFGSLMGVLATVCSANGLIVTFLFGLLDVAIYGVMCWLNWRRGAPGLGNAILHFVYFVPMQFVGFWQWRKRGAKAASQVKARRLTGRQRWLLTGVFLLATVVLYAILHPASVRPFRRRRLPPGCGAHRCHPARVQHHRPGTHVNRVHGAVGVLDGGQRDQHHPLGHHPAVYPGLYLCTGLCDQVRFLPVELHQWSSYLVENQ